MKSRIFRISIILTAILVAPFSQIGYKVNASTPTLTLVESTTTVDGSKTYPTFKIKSSQSGYILYYGECKDDKFEVIKDTTYSLVFKNLKNKTYPQGNFDGTADIRHQGCAIRVLSADSKISDYLNFPSFKYDVNNPGLVITRAVSSPFNITNNVVPTIQVSVDEEISEIIYTGACDSATTVLQKGKSQISLRDTTTKNSLATGTYSNCTIKVKDSKNNFSQQIQIPTFTLINSTNISIQLTDGPDIGNNSIISQDVRLIDVNVSNVGYIRPKSGSKCNVYPSKVTAGTNELYLFALDDTTYSNNETGDFCTLTYSVQTSAFGEFISKDLNIQGIGSFTDRGNPTLVGNISVSTSSRPKINNVNIFEGGTWSVEDYGSSSCDIVDLVDSNADNKLTEVEIADNIIFPGVNTLELDFKQNGSTKILTNGTYSESSQKCLLRLTDFDGNSTTVQIPEFTINDSISPVLNYVSMTSSPVQVNSKVEVWFESSELIPTGSLTPTNITLSGDCFDRTKNKNWPSNPTFGDTGDYDVDTTDYGNISDSNDDVLSVGRFFDINRFEINSISEGEYLNCGFKLKDYFGNTTSTFEIPDFYVGAKPIVISNLDMPSSTTTNPVTFSFKSNTAGTFSFTTGPCSVNGRTYDIDVVSGTNTYVLDNLSDTSHTCTIKAYANGVESNPLTLGAFTVSKDPTPSLKKEGSFNTKDLILKLNSDTNGDLTYSGLCSSNSLWINKGLNTITFNKLPSGTVVTDCSVIVLNNGYKEVLNISAFKVGDEYVGSNNEELDLEVEGAVYRFLNTDRNNTHFYTSDPIEAELVLTKFGGSYNQEKANFKAIKYNNGCQDNNSSVVYRYLNSRTNNTHFYAIKDEEISALDDKFSNNFKKEKVAFCAYLTQKIGTVPVYRWLNTVTGDTHFYSSSETEKDVVNTKFQNVFKFEGVAFYAESL